MDEGMKGSLCIGLRVWCSGNQKCIGYFVVDAVLHGYSWFARHLPAFGNTTTKALKPMVALTQSAMLFVDHGRYY